VELYLYSPYGPYGMYRASVPVQGCTLPFLPINLLKHTGNYTYQFNILKFYIVITWNLCVFMDLGTDSKFCLA